MRRHTLLLAPLVVLFLSLAGSAMAQAIQGTATYRERMTLPPGAVLEVTLEDVSRADAPADVIGRTRLTSPGNPPYTFTITYDPAKIQSNRRYVVRARIRGDGKLLFTTDTATPVITAGSPTRVALVLRRVGTGQPPPPAAGGTTPLEGTFWRATELAGKPTPKQEPQREAHLQFQPGGRVSGSDGCNRVTGTYMLTGDRITFEKMATTQMACADSAAIEGPFNDALKRATRLTRSGDRLELLDPKGTRLAVFTAGASASGALGTSGTSGASAASSLAGTAWRLVKFQSSDDTTLTPTDRSKYTIEFGADGALTARFDCNRGRGTWTSNGPSSIEFGPLALTRAACPPPSLHDQLAKQWGNIRSYVMRDGHLFLALKIDGGIYEFEPIAK